jgi:hypothetical protein
MLAEVQFPTAPLPPRVWQVNEIDSYQAITIGARPSPRIRLHRRLSEAETTRGSFRVAQLPTRSVRWPTKADTSYG